MALFFAIGSLCFLVGPFPGFANLVGGRADAITFFVGSILFTAGGALQSCLAFPERHADTAGRAAWWAAIIQSAGTLFFNVTTYQALHTALSNPEYDRLVWRPDAFGSVCFLVSGAIAYRASPRHGWLPMQSGPRMVGAGGQPARLHLLRDRGDRRLPGPVERLDTRPRRLELEHGARRRLLPRVRRGDAVHRPHRQVAPTAAAPARARARRRARSGARRIAHLSAASAHRQRAFEHRLLERPRPEHVAGGHAPRAALQRLPQRSLRRPSLRQHDRRDRR